MPFEQRIIAVLAFFFLGVTFAFLVHQNQTFAGSLPGHSLGIIGTLIMLLTFVYPFKKRLLKKKGKQNPLSSHMLYGLVGPSLVVIHSAHKFGSLIGILTFLSLFFVVFSGIVGRFLYGRVSRTLREQNRDLQTLKDVFEQRRKEFIALWTASTVSTEQAESESLDAGRRYRELLQVARSMVDLEESLNTFSGTKAMFARWLKVHRTLTFFLMVMVGAHIVTTLYYGLRWWS